MGISTVAAIAAVGSLAVSAYSAYSSGEAAEEQTEAMQDVAAQQTAVSQAQWNRYLKKFAPLEDLMISEVSKPIEQQPGFLGAMGAVDRGYANVAANLRRTMAGRYPYGAGMEGETQKTLELQRPRAKAGVYGTFAQNRLANMLNVASLGKGLPATAMAGLGTAGAQYGNLAGMQGQAAAQTWGGIGSTMGNMAQYYLLNKYLNQNPATLNLSGNPLALSSWGYM